MGYRNYFVIAEKEKVDEFLKLSEEDRVRFSFKQDIEKGYMDQEEVDNFVKINYINSFVFKQEMDGEEIHECGKYFDNETAEKIKEGSIDLSNEDGEINVKLKPEALLVCAEHYKQNTIKWWDNIIKSMDMTDEEIEEDWKNYPEGRPNIKDRLIYHLRDLENNYIDILDTKPEHKYHITTSWSYEYTMFELVHLYKTIDWNKYDLIWLGY